MTGTLSQTRNGKRLVLSRQLQPVIEGIIENPSFQDHHTSKVKYNQNLSFQVHQTLPKWKLFYHHPLMIVKSSQNRNM